MDTKKRKTTWISEENHERIRQEAFKEHVTFYEYLNMILKKYFEKK